MGDSAELWAGRVMGRVRQRLAAAGRTVSAARRSLVSGWTIIACLRRRGGLAIVAVTVVALPGAAALGGVPAAHRAAAPVVWKQVATTCDEHANPPQVAVGLACWDRQGLYPDQWSVTSETATWKASAGFTESYTYHVPSEISSQAPGTVDLTATAEDQTNGSGINSQVCVISQFTVNPVGGGDPCARASATQPGTSNSGTKMVELNASGTPTNADCPVRGFGCATVIIGIGNGGHLIFTYKRTAAATTKIKYSFGGGGLAIAGGSQFALSVRGSGTFDVAGDITSRSSATGEPFDLHGSAVIAIRGDGARDGRIVLSATGGEFFYRAPGGIGAGGKEVYGITRVHYVVTQSSSSCMHGGELQTINLYHRVDQDVISFIPSACQAKKYGHVTATISVKVAK